MDYVNITEAKATGLARVTSSGLFRMAVDNTTNLALNTPRKSVRISSNTAMTKGQLLFMDARHVPTGCATWPAFVRRSAFEQADWTVDSRCRRGLAERWRDRSLRDGERVSRLSLRSPADPRSVSQNQNTLHTANGCTLKTPMQATGKVRV